MVERMKCAFFPITDRTVPIIRFLNEYSHQYQIVALISFQDVGIIGRDGASVDFGAELGMPVYCNIDSTCNLWDTLIVADEQSLTNNRQKNDTYLNALIKQAIVRGKSVVCTREISVISEMRCKTLAESKQVDFSYLNKNRSGVLEKSSGGLEKLNAFYAIFGSILGDASSLTVFLKCVEQLEPKHKVSVISTDINAELYGAHTVYHIIHSRLSETEKIYALNQYIKAIELSEKPELVLVLMLEPIIEYSESVPNDFGIVPYLISKAIPADFFECSVPYAFGNTEFVLELSDGIERQNGYPVNSVHFSNVVVDYTLVDELGFMSATYVPISRIKALPLQHAEGLSYMSFDWTEDEGNTKLAFKIENELRYYQNQRRIL